MSPTPRATSTPTGSVVGHDARPVTGPAGGGFAERPFAGTLEDWQSEPGGLTVVAEVSADPPTFRAVSGQNVWGSFSTPSDALIVIAALARETIGGTTTLDLTGVRMLAYEPRRRSLGPGSPGRSGSSPADAPTRRPRWTSRGEAAASSPRSGRPEGPRSAGQPRRGLRARGLCRLDDGLVLEPTRWSCAPTGPELALRFTGLAASEAAELDAAVFRELVRTET